MAAPRPSSPAAPAAKAPGGAPVAAKLQPGSPMQRPVMATPQSAPVKRPVKVQEEQFYEEKDPEAGLVPLSIMCFVLALVLLAAQLLATDKVFQSAPGEQSSVMVPLAENPDWESYDADSDSYKSSFDKVLAPIPE